MANFFRMTVMILCAGVGSTASSAPEKTMAISVDPSELLYGETPINFSIALAEKFSLGVGIYGKFFSLGRFPVLGMGGLVSSKFHLTANTFQDGWFVKPEIHFGYLTLGNPQAKSASLTGIVVMGHEWVFTNGLLVSVGIGGRFTHLFASTHHFETIPFGILGFGPSFECTIGWAF